jgi:hypothetical protein
MLIPNRSCAVERAATRSCATVIALSLPWLEPCIFSRHGLPPLTFSYAVSHVSRPSPPGPG